MALMIFKQRLLGCQTVLGKRIIELRGKNLTKAHRANKDHLSLAKTFETETFELDRMMRENEEN